MNSLVSSNQSHIWSQSLSNKLGCFALGNDMGVQGTNTIEFIHQSEIPLDCNVISVNFVLDFKLLKTEQRRVKAVMGGDRLKYLFDTGSPATSILESKLLINSTISDARIEPRFLGADVKDYFPVSPKEENQNT